MNLRTTYLTEEGKKIARNIIGETIDVSRPLIKKQKIKSLEIQQNEFYVLSLEQLIQNSKDVVTDCDSILEQITTKEEYLKSEAKVAKLIHTRFIERLTRVLEFRTPIPPKIE